MLNKIGLALFLYINLSPAFYLHEAVKENNLSKIKELISKPGIEINEQNNNGKTALYIAFVKGFDDITTYLLEKGADPNIRNKDGDPLIHVAIKMNMEPKEIDLMLITSSNLDIRNGDNKTPLMIAAQLGYENWLISLMDAGADLNLLKRQNYDDQHLALCYAAENGHLKCIKLLLARGSDIGPYTVHYAIKNNWDSCVKYINSFREKSKNNKRCIIN